MKLFALLGSVSMVLAVNAAGNKSEERSTLTCADPTTAVIAVQAYSPSWNGHMWDPLLETFVRANSVGAFGFQLQGPLARVFPGPSDFTVPVYRLSNAGGGDWVFIVSTDGTAPSRGGYSVDGIFAYVYSTPICESVPLYSVFNPGLVDHWYTTDVNGYNYMLELSEWVDEGIMGYVLPLDCESCSS